MGKPNSRITHKPLLLSLCMCLSFTLNAIGSTTSLKEMKLSELKALDTSTFDKKELKLHKKLVKKKQKKWDRAYKKAKKSFDKAEENRLSGLLADPYFMALNYTAIEDGEFSETPSAIGPSLLVDGAEWTGVFVKVQMRSFDSERHQIYVHDSYNNKNTQYFFNRANFSGGKVADFTQISWDLDWCNSIGCRRHEIYGLNLTKEELATIFLAGDDIRFQAKSKAGYKKTIQISHNYLKGYVAAINGKIKVIDSEQLEKATAEMMKLKEPRKFEFDMEI